MHPDAMRGVMRTFATGVTVVTASHDGVDQGMTVNSLTSVSLDPPLILVCLAHGARTLEMLHAAGRFAVTVLGEAQQAHSARFTAPIADRFDGVDVDRDEHGVPVLSGGVGHLRCTVHAAYPGGDHGIVVGPVYDAGSHDGQPLVLHDGGYTTLSTRRAER